MELNEYQEKAMKTCMPPCDNLLYMLTNLMGEVGEFAGKIAKHVRKGDLYVYHASHRDDNGDVLHSQAIRERNAVDCGFNILPLPVEE